MTDWKEGVIKEYHALERGKQIAVDGMMKNPALCQLRAEKKDIEEQIAEQDWGYKEDIRACDLKMQTIRDNLIERWGIEGKSFKCDEGSAIIRTTRALKVNDKEKLISTLQQIGKLTQCIKGWDLIYLRKLADAGMFDIDAGEFEIVHYDEKRNVVISAVKKGSNRDEE